MRVVLEKIHLRITLLCRKHKLDFNIKKTETQISYQFRKDTLGFIVLHILNPDNVLSLQLILEGTNEGLLKVSDDINKYGSILGLPIDNYYITRQNYKDSYLTISFNEGELDKIEQSELGPIESDSKKKKYPSRAYTRGSIRNDAIILPSQKFFRPEHYYLKFPDDSQPDENGNINCYFCVDCTNCENCIGCIGCSDCSDCTNCTNCNECNYCYDSVYCTNCQHCCNCDNCINAFYSDNIILNLNSGSCLFSERSSSIHYNSYSIFPDVGSMLYHEKIESFFLINHFVPYHRPYDRAANYNWHIQWRISRNRRRYWITEEPTKKYFSINELIPFIFMNKLKYQQWEIECFIKEWYNLDSNEGIRDIKSFMDDIILSREKDSETIYDEIKTKNPSMCIYNELLYKDYSNL